MTTVVDTLKVAAPSAATLQTTDQRGSVDAVFTFVSLGVSLCMAAGYLASRAGVADLHLFEVCASLVLAIALIGFPTCARIKAPVLVATLALGVYLAANVLGHHTHDPLALEMRAVGKGHCDAFFHAAVSSIWSTYGVISTGLNGLVPWGYHVGSHIMYATLASIMRESVFNFYIITFPIAIVPLFVKAVLTAANNLRKIFSSAFTIEEVTSVNFWVVALTLIVGCFPPPLRKLSGLAFSAPYCSESQTTALILFLFGVAALVKLKSRGAWFLPPWLMLLTATKVPWLALGPLSLGFLFVREKFFRTPAWFAAMAVAAAGAYVVNRMVGASECQGQGGLQLSYGDIFQYLPAGHHLEFIVLYSMPVWSLIAFTLWRKVKPTPAQLCAGLWVIFFAMANLIELRGGAATFFLDPIRWMALVSLLALIPLNWKKPAAAAAVSVLILVNVSWEAVNAIKRNNQERRQITRLEMPLKAHPAYMIRQKLESLQDDADRDTALFIPQSCKPYWEASFDKYIPFEAAALSGLASIDGLPPYGREVTNYGFEMYTPRTAADVQITDRQYLLNLAKQKGFKHLIVLDWQDGEATVTRY